VRRARDLLVILTGVLAATLASGCTQIAVYVEHDPTVSFEGLQTYDWGESKIDFAERTQTDNQIFDSRVRSTVEAELARRGFERVEDGDPDFLVAYSAAIDVGQQTVTIDRYGGYTQSTYLSKSGTSRDYPRSTTGQQKVVYDYQQGSLILNVSLPEPRRRIWRAYARSVIDPEESQKARDDRLREAVRRMLADFPPR
jgi:hypothetical protein